MPPSVLLLGIFASIIGHVTAGVLQDALETRFFGDQSDRAVITFVSLHPLAEVPSELRNSSDGRYKALLDWTHKAVSSDEGNVTDGTFASHLAAFNTLLDGLSPNASWAAVRRLFLSVLVLRELDNRTLSSAEEHMAEQLLLRLYDEHQAVMERKQYMEFTHISKSGGSSFCHLAHLTGCKTAHNENCIIRIFQDQCRWYSFEAAEKALAVTAAGTQLTCKAACHHRRRPKEISCAARREFLESKGMQFYANEYTTLGGEAGPEGAHTCHEEMTTVLQVRDPHARVRSHVQHWWRFLNLRCAETRDLYFPRGLTDVHTWKNLMPAVLDNYIARSLLGEAVFHLPFDSITGRHIELAKALVLREFDVLLVTGDAELHNLTVETGLGWCPFEVHDLERPYRNSTMPLDVDFLWVAVEGLNARDVELYRFILVCAQLDAVMYEVVNKLSGRSGGSPVSNPTGRSLRQSSRLAQSLSSPGLASANANGCSCGKGKELKQEATVPSSTTPPPQRQVPSARVAAVYKGARVVAGRAWARVVDGEGGI